MKKYIILLSVIWTLISVFGCSHKFDFINPVDPKIPPSKPVLLSPTNISTGIDINPVLAWNAADGAASYTLQVSDTGTFSRFVYNQSGIVSTRDTITGLFYSTVYYWRVRADKKDISSEWSSAWQFITRSATAPTVVTDAATNITQTTAQLNGAVNPNGVATTYYFQYGLTASYGSNTPVLSAGSGSSPVAVNANIGSLAAGTIYHYRVAATNSGGTSYSNDGVFITIPAAPILNAPINGATGISITPALSWNASTGANSYALQVSTDSLFGSFVYNQYGLASTSQAISGLAADTKYYWRVNAANASGVSGWSFAWSFITGIPPAVPVLLAPANNATGIAANPVLTWNASSGATSYTLQVSPSSSFISFVYNQSGLTNTSQNVGLGAGMIYYWRVNATNSIGTSDWSSVWSFTTWGPIEWIFIPAGNFKMGSLPTDPYAQTDEQPQHLVYLDDYQISKYEITNAQYKDFMDAGGYSNSTYWTTEGWDWRTANTITEPLYWTAGTYNSGPSFPNHPVVGVSWYEAYAFCFWAGGHLPTEAQWEKAARGTDSSNYWPWGSIWDASKCNSYYNTPPDTFVYSSPVGFFTAGQSPYGAYDMAGNVWEWCNDRYHSDYYSVSPITNPTGPTTGTARVFRGGSFDNYGLDNFCRTAKRMSITPGDRYGNFGFRIAQ